MLSLTVCCLSYNRNDVITLPHSSDDLIKAFRLHLTFDGSQVGGLFWFFTRRAKIRKNDFKNHIYCKREELCTHASWCEDKKNNNKSKISKIIALLHIKSFTFYSIQWSCVQCISSTTNCCNYGYLVISEARSEYI